MFIQTEQAAQTEGILKDDIRALKDELFQLNDFKLQKVCIVTTDTLNTSLVVKMTLSGWFRRLMLFPQIDIENELEEIKAARDNEKRIHKEQIRDLEREIVREKDRLTKEMESRLKEIKAELLTQSKSRLDKVCPVVALLRSCINH